MKGGATYDPEADAIAVRFKPEGSKYAESEEVAPGVILDFDAEGRVIGVELLSVRELLEKGSLAEPAGDAAKKPAAAKEVSQPDS
jgi:uncharacterized protein YuzE